MTAIADPGRLGELPPHDIDAERAVLGAMMMSGGVLADCAGMLTAAAFLRPAHQLIFEALASLAESGTPADWLTAGSELERRGTLAQAGGPLYLNDCLHAVPAAANGPWYARRLLDLQARRSVITAATRIAQIGADPGLSPAERGDTARAALDACLPSGAGNSPRSVAEIVSDTVRRIEEGGQRGIPTPWADLNDVITGLAPGEMIIVAARPSTGKSIVGAQLAAYAALSLGLPSLLVSMEMSAEELMMRLISAEARVSLTHLLRAEVTSDDDWGRISRAASRLAASPLEIDDASDCSLSRLRARLTGMQRGAGCGLLVLDYLGLMTPPKAENRQNQVAVLSRELKKIAREFEIPVVVLAQLNRTPESRHDKRPAASDLRDSGAQEQDADMVLLLHQPEENPGTLEVIVAKQRQGPRNITVSLSFQGWFARCADLSRRY